MPTINIPYLKSGEESPYQRQNFISDIMTFRAPYEQSRAIKSRLVRVLEWKITQIVQGHTQYFDGDPEQHCLALYILR